MKTRPSLCIEKYMQSESEWFGCLEEFPLPF